MTLQTLLEPLEINHMTLKNRIMFPPMTTGYEARDGSITEQSINFYKRVAEGGASYIVLGDVTPVHTISPTPKLVNDDQIPSFKALADALHEFDCKLGLQVFHPEYDTVAVAELFAKGDMAGARAKLHHDMQHYINEVTGERLQEILVHITALARRATQAGADAIEVHGDRLVGSLCSPLINQRTDEYGGSFENRTRFARAVVRAIREGSPDICIDYKLPIITENPQLGRGGLFIDEAVTLAQLLEEDGVDTFHAAQANHTGNLNDTIPAMGTRPECFMEPYSRRIKEAVHVPVSMVGRIMTPEDGARLIEENACDFVGFGRPILCDPDYANKVAAGQADLIRPCIMYNHGCTDAIASRRFISCVLNAENGYEYKRVITPAETPRKIAVVGGGPAGMEAARVAALRGHDVTLYEQADRLGGQLGIAAEESSTVKPFIMEDFAAHNVVVKTNTKVDRITADAVEATETLNPPAPAGRPGAPAPVPAADAPEPETQAISIPCDCVVIASGTAPVTFDTAALEEHGIKVTLVGDCNGKAADINRAVEEGYLAATAA
ncbi:NADH oxidase [Bifidobacterium pullorum subsp. saeculare DSM 6531 = LMG 14934]|uniref:NADH oxidase n=1 Tax=Bifidobacterium pullorum subsp. saeculare DSM 6531 = LMG 14934 TaxID=1437611 RepID=A0A087D053_9BIFI|nr:bilirubin reductase [Bifidobacterium pullorum]KFI88903.1 NADH oxidase [Bifidobacterium pullorum subsp. saeculare DSM 6531 = LMG 14934]